MQSIDHFIIDVNKYVYEDFIISSNRKLFFYLYSFLVEVLDMGPDHTIC